MAITAVRVQVPLRVPNGTRGQNRPLVSFYDILKHPLILRMRCSVIFRERVATFFLKKMSFLSELQPWGFFRTILDMICTEPLPDLEQLLLVASGRVYKNFRVKGLAGDDLSVETLKHCKNGEC